MSAVGNPNNYNTGIGVVLIEENPYNAAQSTQIWFGRYSSGNRKCWVMHNDSYITAVDVEGGRIIGYSNDHSHGYPTLDGGLFSLNLLVTSRYDPTATQLRICIMAQSTTTVTVPFTIYWMKLNMTAAPSNWGDLNQ